MDTTRDRVTALISEPMMNLPPVRYNTKRADELGMKLQARLFLIWADWTRKIVTPTHEEWVGIGLLERDDQLPPRKN